MSLHLCTFGQQMKEDVDVKWWNGHTFVKLNR